MFPHNHIRNHTYMMAMVKFDQHTTPQGKEAADLVENYEVFGHPQFNHFLQ